MNHNNNENTKKGLFNFGILLFVVIKQFTVWYQSDFMIFQPWKQSGHVMFITSGNQSEIFRIFPMWCLGKIVRQWTSILLHCWFVLLIFECFSSNFNTFATFPPLRCFIVLLVIEFGFICLLKSFDFTEYVHIFVCVAAGCSASSPRPWFSLAPARVTTTNALTGRSASSWEQIPAASVSTATRASAARRSSVSTLSTANPTCCFPQVSSRRRPTSAYRYAHTLSHGGQMCVCVWCMRGRRRCWWLRSLWMLGCVVVFSDSHRWGQWGVVVQRGQRSHCHGAVQGTPPGQLRHWILPAIRHLQVRAHTTAEVYTNHVLTQVGYKRSILRLSVWRRWMMAASTLWS